MFAISLPIYLLASSVRISPLIISHNGFNCGSLYDYNKITDAVFKLQQHLQVHTLQYTHAEWK